MYARIKAEVPSPGGGSAKSDSYVVSSRNGCLADKRVFDQLNCTTVPLIKSLDRLPLQMLLC